VSLGVSNRHIHLSADHLRVLFGDRPLTSARALTQPGQFAASEALAVVGPKGRIDAVRVVGPARGETQVELAMSDAVTLGVKPPVAASGALQSSVGGVTLVGPNGRVELSRGVIIAARHLHLAPGDAARWGLRDGDRLDVRCGTGARAVTLHDVLVRSGDGHATELHVDADEARAAGVHTGDPALIIGWRSATPRRRALITERDVLRMARAGERLPDGALLTPSARDRARALGLLRE
jgi:putative phosphotransacetylase